MHASEAAGLVARYARTFHAVVGDRHHVASPLGAWLLLALCGPAAGGADRRELADVLGCEPDEAAAVAAALLEAPHPAVGAAAAVWNKEGAGDPRWLAGLPASVERGPVPGQDEANAWARERTFGLIDRFPITITDDIYLLLATALATKVSWECPFEVGPASSLGAASPWAGRVERVLLSPEHHGHSAFVAATAEAGDVGVHVGRAREGIAVVSVIATAAAVLGKGDPWTASQAAMARYTRIGFEAAAVTAMAIRSSMPPGGPRRTAELRFAHPFAVMAVAAGELDGRRHIGNAWTDRWNGVPVFSAWVTEPLDAERGDRGE